VIRILRSLFRRRGATIANRSIVKLSAGAVSLVVAAGVAGMSGCATTTEKVADTKPRIESIAQASFVKDWQASVFLNPGEKITHIYALDDAIHTYSNLNFDRAFSPASGELLYANEVKDPRGSIMGQPVPLSGGRIAYPTNNSIEVYNLHGRLLQSVPLGFSATSGACGFGSTVFIGDGGGKIACVDVSRTYAWIKWELLTFGVVVSQPVAFQGEIYVASQDGSVRAFNDSHEPGWPLLTDSMFKTGDKILADVKADVFGVYFASTDGRLYCVNRGTGKLKWQYFAPAALTTPPFVTATSVYQFVPGLGLVALDKTQKLVLNTPDNEVVDENPVRMPRWVCPNATALLTEDSQYAYALGTNHLVLALDLKTGKQAFTSTRTDFVAFGASVKKPEMYAAGPDGSIYAFHAVTTPGGTGEIVQNDAAVQTPVLAMAK
jgi:hypothetical protein